MKYLMRKKMNKKGFSLIELIVVIAILAIIAAIAIPRFAAIQAKSEVKSDAATASEIVNAARIWYSDTDATAADVTALIAEAAGAIAELGVLGYLPDGIDAQSASEAPDAADDFQLVFNATVGAETFEVRWTPDNTATTVQQMVDELSKYVFTK